MRSSAPRPAIAIPAPDEDPRIRERRLQVREIEDQRRRRLVMAVATVVAIATGIWGLTRSPLLAVRGVSLSGNEHTPSAEIVHAAGLDGARPMLDLDTHSMAQAVEALPWVDRAVVTRHWPRQVTVRVTERRAVGVVPARRGGMAVVDGTGRVLSVVPTPAPGLPAVVVSAAGASAPASVSTDGAGGPDQAGDPGTTMSSSFAPALAVASALTPSLLGLVQAVVASAGGQVTLDLPGGGHVQLGSMEGLPDKLTSLATVLAKLGPTGVGTRTLDVRVAAAPVLTDHPSPQ